MCYNAKVVLCAYWYADRIQFMTGDIELKTVVKGSKLT